MDGNLIKPHTISVLVDNDPGVLARVIEMFSGRGYNIESLTVAEIDPAKDLSRITIVTSGNARTIQQIRAQLGSIIPVHSVIDLTEEFSSVERELALIKVHGLGEKRVEALRVAEVFRARALDATPNSFIFEVTGSTAKIDAFIKLMKPLGLVDISRTGVAAISRGAEPMNKNH